MLTLPPPGAVRVTPASALGLPAVGRAIGVVSGVIRQMTLDAYKDGKRLPRSRFLTQPDPSPGAGRAWWVGQHVEDYLIHGNAVHLITARGADGYPLAAQWIPAEWVALTTNPEDGGLDYWVCGHRVNREDVVHVRRRSDRFQTGRGVGVVEQHLTAFGRFERQASYETQMLEQSGVPTVVVETPNPDLSQQEADDASDRWLEKFSERRPAFLPAGTKVTPLAWSPSDSQMVEAKQLGLQDVANIFNLDGFWIGAEYRGMTYKSSGPLYLGLLRQTIAPITLDLRETWGPAWLPWGQELRFATREVLADDMTTDVAWIRSAIDAGLITVEQGQEWLGFPTNQEMKK